MKRQINNSDKLDSKNPFLGLVFALVEARVVMGGADHHRVVGGYRFLLSALFNLLGGYSRAS